MKGIEHFTACFCPSTHLAKDVKATLEQMWMAYYEELDSTSLMSRLNQPYQTVVVWEKHSSDWYTEFSASSHRPGTFSPIGFTTISGDQEMLTLPDFVVHPAKLDYTDYVIVLVTKFLTELKDGYELALTGTPNDYLEMQRSFSNNGWTAIAGNPNYIPFELDLTR